MMPGLQEQMGWAFFEDHTALEDGKQKSYTAFR